MDMNSKLNVHFGVIAFGVAVIILITKATSFLEPYDSYFTFTGFLYESPEQISWRAIVIKFGIPIIVGLLVGFIAKDNPKGNAGVVGFLSSFILAWPVLVEWELLAPSSVQERRNAFLVIYSLYFGSYTYLCICGSRVTTIYLEWLSANKNQDRKDIIADVLDWKNTIKPILLGVLSAIFSVYLQKIFS